MVSGDEVYWDRGRSYVAFVVGYYEIGEAYEAQHEAIHGT